MNIKYIVILLSFLCFVPSPVFADYVLPYPSYMPGNKLYAVSRVFDRLNAYWYWGSIASFRYHLGLADKYLVEAKTLFEYKQYVLASDALKRSTLHIAYLPHIVEENKELKKDVTSLQVKLHDALIVHKEILTRLVRDLPEEFTWIPEKSPPSVLHLRTDILYAIDRREDLLSQ